MQAVVMKPFQMGAEQLPVGTIVDTNTIRNTRALLSQRFLQPCQAGEMQLPEDQLATLCSMVVEALKAEDVLLTPSAVEAICKRVVAETVPALVEAAVKAQPIDTAGVEAIVQQLIADSVPGLIGEALRKRQGRR